MASKTAKVSKSVVERRPDGVIKSKRMRELEAAQQAQDHRRIGQYRTARKAK